MRAIEHADKYQPGNPYAGLAFHNHAQPFVSIPTSASRPANAPGPEDCVSDKPISQATQEWHLRHQEVWDQLGRIPVHYREAIVLVSVLGESYIARPRSWNATSAPSRAA